MGELRLYALAVGEMCAMVGAPPADAAALRETAREAFAAPSAGPIPARTGLAGKLGPLFRRVPAAPVVSPTDPTPADVEALLTGGPVPPDRVAATWRVLETLVARRAWSAVRLPLSPAALDELDFALARGGVSAAVGLRHLLQTPTGVAVMGVPGLTVGYHRHDLAVAMAEAYRRALPEVADPDRRALVAALVGWLEGFGTWSEQARAGGRARPDLIGFGVA